MGMFININEKFRGRSTMKVNQMGLRFIAAGIAVLLVFQLFIPGLAQGRVIDTAAGYQKGVIRGEFSHGTLGEVSIFGDFNNDNIADLLIGAPASSSGGRTNSGAAYVILGGKGRSNANLATSRANWWIYGAESGDILGHSVAAGDINGDGIDDIIIGADRVFYNEAMVGAVYIFLGRSSESYFSRTSALSPSSADITIYGEFAGGRFGRAVAAGDVTGNNIADLVIGSYLASPGGRVEAGAIYVIQGRTTFPAVIDLRANPGQANLRIYGAGGASAAFISAVEAGQIAASLFDDEFSSPLGVNAAAGDRLGRSVAVGDVNGDGILDVISGAYLASPGGRQMAGTTYIFYGKTQYQNAGSVIDLGSSGQASVAVHGKNAGDQSGFYVAAGKVDNNPYADVLIGAYTAASQAGEVYLVYGQASLPSQINLSSHAGLITFRGAAAGDRLGRSLALGDVNDNGRDDILMGASRATPPNRPQAGIAYVVYTDQTLPASIVMNQTGINFLQIYGEASGNLVQGTPNYCDRSSQEDGILTGDCPDELGRAIAAGDFDGDGMNDIVVGALFAKNGPYLNAGAVYVISTQSRIFMPQIMR
jgi:hypothetical protein